MPRATSIIELYGLRARERQQRGPSGVSLIEQSMHHHFGFHAYACSGLIGFHETLTSGSFGHVCLTALVSHAHLHVSFQFIFCRIYRISLYVIAPAYFPSQFPFGVECMPVLYVCVLTGAAVFILYRLFLHSYRVLPHILCCYVFFLCLLECKKLL